MRAKIGVALLLLVTAAYCWGLLWIAFGFARAGGVIGWGLATGLVVLLVLTVWVTWREVLFGLRAGRLARLYGAARFEPGTTADRMGADGTGAATGADGTSTADGTDGVSGASAGEAQDPVALRDARKAAARAEFEAARDAVQDGGEDDWRAWYRLGLAYSANRDTRDARAAVRRAIALEAGRRA